MTTALLSAWRATQIRLASRQRHAREREHREAFQAFYRSLPNRIDPFYMFFTSGLLHWALKVVELVPADVNLVLLGSDLSPDEQASLRLHTSRPFHAIRVRVSDATIWEWLFDVNESNFGWLDVDCLVLNPRLFREMAQIGDTVAMKGCWCTYPGWAFLATYFVFLNRRVLDDVRARVKGVSPRVVHRPDHRDVRRGEGILLRPHHRAIAQAVGSPRQFFDTTQFYQMSAVACGYSLQPVRFLKNDPRFNHFCSDELLHVSGVASFRRVYLHMNSTFTYDIVLRATIDYLLLRALSAKLPASYALLTAQSEQMLGGDLYSLCDAVHAFLLRNGLTERALLSPSLRFLQYIGPDSGVDRTARVLRSAPSC